jgi:hypothetical protein
MERRKFVLEIGEFEVKQLTPINMYIYVLAVLKYELRIERRTLLQQNDIEINFLNFRRKYSQT